MTTYDDIFKCFVVNAGIDTSRLPSEDYKIHDMIINGINHYNSKIGSSDYLGELAGNNLTEAINLKLDGTRLLLLAYCIKYVYLENQLVEFEELWTPFQKDMGFKNYREQVRGRESTLERTEQKILEYLSKIEDRSLM